MSPTRILIVAAIVTAPFAGCSRTNAPATFPVRGIVQYKNEPVEGATVTLVPKQPSLRSASGVTDAEGNFSVTTYYSPSEQPTGAMPGQYAVTVIKRDFEKLPEGLLPEEEALAFAKLGPPKHLLPKKHVSPNTTPFSIEIVDVEPEPLTLMLE